MGSGPAATMSAPLPRKIVLPVRLGETSVLELPKIVFAPLPATITLPPPGPPTIASAPVPPKIVSLPPLAWLVFTVSAPAPSATRLPEPDRKSVV